MKIDNSIKKTGSLPVGTTEARGSKGAEKSGGAAKASSAGTAQQGVQISSQLQALAGGEGVFDTQKVAEIKAAIAEGRFQVDPEKVANGLLDSVKDLIHSRKA
ncbi:flagellar biosynthesis anti-sigma factor FlgM [Janthinobacterium sp. 17J80-10]|uniref:flagellar biosynthesis anti-sigma factor FlgM n=1 Tax=Janthinobacterium sp. 17J80-10 TaxID=2497863 RepID=UPI0010053EA6|nr:flagellar biosynthesis anti-sigma factor FlgM [Janthinobacterium sp. 17J80-10]QAU34340.1 flagellar biosynthesis anti-sigma factor FlgM [Janthinobacterium sp. 17J80-10]